MVCCYAGLRQGVFREWVNVFKRDQVGWGAQCCVTQCQICPEGVRHLFVCFPFSLYLCFALSILYLPHLREKGPSCHIMSCVCVWMTIVRLHKGVWSLCEKRSEVITMDGEREFPEPPPQSHPVTTTLRL